MSGTNWRNFLSRLREIENISLSGPIFPSVPTKIWALPSLSKLPFMLVHRAIHLKNVRFDRLKIVISIDICKKVSYDQTF